MEIAEKTLIETLATQTEKITLKQIQDWFERVESLPQYEGDDNLSMMIFIAGAEWGINEIQ